MNDKDLVLQVHPGIEHKFARFGEALSLDGDAVIAGHASLFGVPDQGGDVVEPGAYAASLAQLAAQGCKVKMLWQHDPAQVIGVWHEVREDARGLWVKGRLLTETARGAEAAALIAAGALDGLSIGYRTKRARRGAGGNRHLTEVELWEVSLVTFPMLPAARVAGKAADPAEDALRGLAAELRRAGNLIAGRTGARRNRRQQA